ncbi:MAG: lipid-A-disaccharide synthase [Tannerella sp.]|jgi:lipid-A-disaccharide synthase|nr:lipid-A-disaccharide synthase [Tannerella sp.]
MNYFLIAGEASGDLHASNLMKELQRCDKKAEFHFLGGDLMQAVGGNLLIHYRKMAYMGVIPVLLHLRALLRIMRTCHKAIRDIHPDVVILVDYPGFNLKIAKYVKTKLHIPVYYYISPKIWAWKKYRIRSFRRYVDRMFCILPFEKEFYKNLNYSVDYVGNPSVDAVAAFREQPQVAKEVFCQDNGLDQKPLIALLAGSRRQEVKDNLPVMIAAAEAFPAYQCVIAGGPGLNMDDYLPVMGGKKIPVLFGQTYSLLSHSEMALVTSGTATLETALFRVPQVVCYYFGGGKLANFIFRHFFHVPYISLVNLIAGRQVVAELFGANFTVKQIVGEMSHLLEQPAYREAMLKGYDETAAILGQPGASQRAAWLIVESLR